MDFVNSSKYPNTDELIKAGDLCPKRNYLTSRDSETSDEPIKYTDRNWPTTLKLGGEEYPVCKPLLDINQTCPGRDEGEIACQPQHYMGDGWGYKKGKCGCVGEYIHDTGEGCKDKDGKLQPMKCLGGISLGDTCPSNKEDYTCSESNIPFGEDRGIYGASCNCILDVDCTCHDAN